jgi:hypothetical protein
MTKKDIKTISVVISCDKLKDGVILNIPISEVSANTSDIRRVIDGTMTLKKLEIDLTRLWQRRIDEKRRSLYETAVDIGKLQRVAMGFATHTKYKLVLSNDERKQICEATLIRVKESHEADVARYRRLYDDSVEHSARSTKSLKDWHKFNKTK